MRRWRHQRLELIVITDLCKVEKAKSHLAHCATLQSLLNHSAQGWIISCAADGILLFVTTRLASGNPLTKKESPIMEKHGEKSEMLIGSMSLK